MMNGIFVQDIINDVIEVKKACIYTKFTQNS